MTPNKQSSKVLRGTIRATNNMISFDNFIWSALLAGVIGGVLGAMLTLKIFGDQEREQAEEDRDRGHRGDRGAPDMGREPVEHDYIPEL